MFENSSVMVLRANTKEDEVYKIEVDAETQNSIITSMSNALDELIAEKGKYYQLYTGNLT